MSTTLLDRVDDRPAVSPAQWLRETSAAVRVSFTWMGVRKTLTPEQKSQAAESFGAEGEFLSAGKKLLDTRHSAYKDVTAVRGKVLAYWKALTLPYPEPGIRLIRQFEIDDFNRQMGGFRGQLAEAAGRLQTHYAELKEAARIRLGDLFNPQDYPSTLRGLFAVDWDFPNIDPPDYLQQLNPAIYQQEQARISRRFEEAVQLAEQAFVGEFAKLIEHLTERLSGTGEGERKIFRDSAISNLTEFFDRFRQLNVRSNEDLDALVQRAQQIVSGVEPDALRDSESLRHHVATRLSQVQSVLDGMMIDQPRRRIIRSTNTGERQ